MVAGSPGVSGTADGDIGTAVRLSQPLSIVRNETSGESFFAEIGNCVVRRLARDGTVSRVLGTMGLCGYQGDGGAATSARINGPVGIALATHDGLGGVLVGEYTGLSLIHI